MACRITFETFLPESGKAALLSFNQTFRPFSLNCLSTERRQKMNKRAKNKAKAKGCFVVIRTSASCLCRVFGIQGLNNFFRSNYLPWLFPLRIECVSRVTREQEDQISSIREEEACLSHALHNQCKIKIVVCCDIIMQNKHPPLNIT